MPPVARKIGGTDSAAGIEVEPLLLHLIKQVELAIRARLDAIVAPAGLTALQYNALTELWLSPSISTAELARHSFVTAQSMADVVAALTQRSLVERRRDDGDRRKLVLSLTQQGQRLLRRYRPKVVALEQQMLSDLTPAQTGKLRSGLNACRTALAE